MRSFYCRLCLWMTAGLAGLMPAGMAQANPDDIAWYQARSVGTLQAYQRYLDSHPTGRYSGDAFACIVAMTEAPDLAQACGPDPGIEPAAGPVGGVLLADPY